jgi:hypothetical protein
LAKTLIDEGLRIEAHPEIVFRTGPAGRRPGLAGGPDIWELARVLREVGQGGGDALNQTSELMGISREAVARVVRYYAEYRSEVDSWIDRVDREAEQSEAAWRREQELLKSEAPAQ